MSVNNFIPKEAMSKCRERFENETKLGRMVGGLGWTREKVRYFLGRDFYVIPCGAVPKGEDPHGRIIHDFSFAPPGEKSINESILDNSVRYITFIERVRALSCVDWYVSVDMKNGYRQVPVHAGDWFSQVYALNENEHYIDLCMPFGKTNSSKIFCHWVSNWCKAFKIRLRNRVRWYFVVKSYVDDIFGGAKTFEHALRLKETLIATGNLTTAKMNAKKCHGPARQLPILGMLFDSIKRRCTLTQKKQQKYIARLEKSLSKEGMTSKELEKMVGYLVYAGWVEPFGRPFISSLSSAIVRHEPQKEVERTE